MVLSERSRRGFSLLELLIVVAMIMVIAAMATPTVFTAMSNYRLRTTASGVAAVCQRARMRAVSDDRWRPVQTDTIGGATIVYVEVDDPLDTSANSPDELTMVAALPRGFTISNGGPDPASMNLDNFSNPAHGMPAFNARGLPCTPASGALTCPSQVATPGGLSGYIFYLRQDRDLGGTGWAAITVTPAGRVRAWTWTGSAWN